MSIDVHSLMSTVNMAKLLKNIQQKSSANIQACDLVRFIEQSEPCLFNNSEGNLMPVKYENISLEKIESLLKQE